MIRKLNIILLFLIPFVQYAQVDYETDIHPIFNNNMSILRFTTSIFSGHKNIVIITPLEEWKD